MKKEIFLVVVSVFLVFLAVFFLFQRSEFSPNQYDPEAVRAVSLEQNSSVFLSSNEGVDMFNYSTENYDISNFSSENALEVINLTKGLIIQMAQQGIPTDFANDTLISIQADYLSAYYSSIVNGQIEVNTSLENEARKYYNLFNLKNSNYSVILSKYLSLVERYNKALFVLDSFYYINRSILDLEGRKGMDVSIIREDYSLAVISFNEDRIEESQKIVENLKLKIEDARNNYASSSLFAGSIAPFFVRNWKIIIFLLVLIILLLFYFSRQIGRVVLAERLRRMKKEKVNLLDLIKKAQHDRFNEGSVSGLVYNIRVGKYRSRIREIEQEVPVIENKLRKYLKK